MNPLLRLLQQPMSLENVVLGWTSKDYLDSIEQGVRHGIAGVVLSILSRGTKVPGLVISHARTAAMQQAARGMKVRNLLFASIDVLEEIGIRPILLKGYGLGLRLYEEPFARATSDVDLLVTPNELPAAVGALSKRLALTEKEEESEHYSEAYRHHVSLEGRLGLVELHFKPLTAFALGWDCREYEERIVSSTIEGKPVRYLSPEDEFIFLATHAANHLFQRLGWIYDLKLLVEKSVNFDWAQVEMRARALGFSYATGTSLLLMERLFNVAVPSEILNSLLPKGIRRWYLARLFSPDAITKADLSERPWLWAMAKFAMADNLLKMLRFSLLQLLHRARKFRAASGLKVFGKN